MNFALLSHLWLYEPDADAIARSSAELGLPCADPAELASAYTDLFLLNVYPYGTIFTDPDAELNGADAQRLAALYRLHSYQPGELQSVGAPDHLGLCLGFAAHLSEKRLEIEIRDFMKSFLEWAPVCCLAVEREPAAHAFYRTLARLTSEILLAVSPTSSHNLEPENPHSASPEGPFAVHSPQSAVPTLLSEVGLSDIVRFFLTPAQCGVFLSRSRLGHLARAIGLRLPIGSRLEVAERLFSAAGESERIDQLLAALQAEIEAWATEYGRWAKGYAHWQPSAELWLERTTRASRMLAEMRQIAEAVST